MKPLQDSATEGRANPKGIPCLYLRPIKIQQCLKLDLLGAIISIGKLETNRDLKILDFSVAHGKFDLATTFLILSLVLMKKKLNLYGLQAMDNAFSRPTRASDLKSDYAPTQIISELVKSVGYDGTVYKSSLGDGHNIALFDLDSATVIGCYIYETSRIKFDFDTYPHP